MRSRCGDMSTALRRGLTVAISVAAALLVVSCSITTATTTTGAPVVWGTCAVPTPAVIPGAWRPVGSGTLVSIDNDDDLECLLVYRYNVTGDNRGPLGSLVLNPEAAADHQPNLEVYRLLPWINRPYVVTSTIPGTPPGYLGIIGEKGYEIRLYDADANGKADELGIVGTDEAGNRTYLSLYRGKDRQNYTLVGYFHGNDRVEIIDAPALIAETKIYSGTVRTVRAVDRLYDRSWLAAVSQYERRAEGTTFDFRSNWIEFADGRPANACYYPEGQILAAYAGSGRPVFDLRLWYEDDRSRRATVCVGYWEISPDQARRYWAIVDMETIQAANPDECDTWKIADKARIEPGRISCNP